MRLINRLIGFWAKQDDEDKVIGPQFKEDSLMAWDDRENNLSASRLLLSFLSIQVNKPEEGLGGTSL